MRQELRRLFSAALSGAPGTHSSCGRLRLPLWPVSYLWNIARALSADISSSPESAGGTVAR